MDAQPAEGGPDQAQQVDADRDVADQQQQPGRLALLTTWIPAHQQHTGHGERDQHEEPVQPRRRAG